MFGPNANLASPGIAQAQCPIIVQSDALQHSAWRAINYVDIFIARMIAGNLKRRDQLATWPLEQVLRTKC